MNIINIERSNNHLIIIMRMRLQLVFQQEVVYSMDQSISEVRYRSISPTNRDNGSDEKDDSNNDNWMSRLSMKIFRNCECVRHELEKKSCVFDGP